MKWMVRAKMKGNHPLDGSIVWPHIEANSSFVAYQLFLRRFGKQIKPKTIRIFQESENK